MRSYTYDSSLVIFMGALVLLGACSTSELPTAISDLRPTAQVGSAGHDDTHEEPDPRVPPLCHGVTATVWYNMPADLIPKGVTLRPAVRGDDHHDILATAADEEEVSGLVIIGTNKRDVIVGSPQRDSILGGNGDDLICADPVRGGEDESTHQPGQGGGGPDHVWGENGHDVLYGGGGPDSLYGGNGNDYLVGGAGPDALYGDNGDDRLEGGVAPDRLYGGNGDDHLSGGLGNDWLWGEAGDDQLYGEGGFDTLDGGSGTNLLDAGEQTDEHDHGHVAIHTDFGLSGGIINRWRSPIAAT